MVSTERASKSEQTWLKQYSLKINRLRDTEEKKCSTRGSCQFLITYNHKKYSPTSFTTNFFILFQHFIFFNNNTDLYQAFRRCVLLFDKVAITPRNQENAPEACNSQ